MGNNDDKIITRAGASALIPEDAVQEIIQHATQNSRFLERARRMRNMTRAEMRMPILTLLPTAYFVGGEAGQESSPHLKETTKAMWNNKYIHAEELAVIVPIPEQVLDDSDFDIWSEISPHVGEAFGLTLDRAVFWGDDAPTSWPTNIFDSIIAAGNGVAEGSQDDLYSDIFGTDGAVQTMEAAGYTPTGWVSKMGMRSKLRDLRTEDDHLLFNQNTIQQATQYSLDGQPMDFPRNGLMMPDDDAELFGLQWDQFVYSVRTEMRMKITDEAILSDSDGNVTLNLFQEDAVAARFTWRLGWQVANPTNRLKKDTEDQAKAGTYVGNPDRYPACALLCEDYGT